MKQIHVLKFFKDKSVFILSPHFDDAILSTGMLMSELDSKTKVTVINVFTVAHTGPYTLSAKQFLKVAGYTDAEKLYKDRASDDVHALSLVHAQHVNLGFTDALFRKHKKLSGITRLLPELHHMYPTYRWHILKSIAKKDSVLNEIIKKLDQIIPKNAVIIAPYGIGNHIDHVVTRKAAEALQRDMFYYVDFPYTIRLQDSGTPPIGYREMRLPVDLEKKSKMIHAYTSQVMGLFKEGIIPEHDEVFFIKTQIEEITSHSQSRGSSKD